MTWSKSQSFIFSLSSNLSTCILAFAIRLSRMISSLVNLSRFPKNGGINIVACFARSSPLYSKPLVNQHCVARDNVNKDATFCEHFYVVSTPFVQIRYKACTTGRSNCNKTFHCTVVGPPMGFGGTRDKTFSCLQDSGLATKSSRDTGFKYLAGWDKVWKLFSIREMVNLYLLTREIEIAELNPQSRKR